MSSYTTTASVKGQVVIPAALRRKYAIQEGTRILIQDEGDRIVLRPVTLALLMQLRGSLKGRGALQALLDERAWDAQHGA
jgi:AbrB family looped-hinge helix DNA binding protein